jgi:hypothetical protein
MNSYIFVLCPPYSGSTLLWKLLSTSDAVSAFSCEGQFLPEVVATMRREPWNAEAEFPWPYIKEVWRHHWDLSKPLLVEKSPANLIRAEAIAEHFSPAYFLVMVRDPYAHCEGLMRRDGFSARGAAEFSMRCFRAQMRNAESLPNVLRFTYCDLVSDPAGICRRIQVFIPELGELRYREKFTVHSIDGDRNRQIVNLNSKKIRNLSSRDIRQINEVLLENRDVMEYWGYDYFYPSRWHFIPHAATRAGLLAAQGLYWPKLIGRKLTSDGLTLTLTKGLARLARPAASPPKSP